MSRMMRTANRAGLVSDAALPLPYGIGLLVRHDLDRAGEDTVAIAYLSRPRAG